MAALKKYIQRNSIKTSMVLFFMLLIAVIVAFLSLTSYRNTIKSSEELSIQYTVSLLKDVNASIDSYIDNMTSMAKVVVENNDVRQLMSYLDRRHNGKLGENEELDYDSLVTLAMGHMDVVAKTRTDITNISIISKYGDIVLSDKDKQVNPYSNYRTLDWFLRPLSYKDQYFVSPSHVQNLIEGEYKWVISISKAITDPVTGEVTGVMVVDLNYRSIESICENVQLGKTGYIYIVDSKRNIIFHPQQQLLYAGIKTESIVEVLKADNSEGFIRLQNDNRIYIRNDSPTTLWTAVGVVNTQELVSSRDYIVRFYIALALVAIAVAGLFAIIISNGITSPLRQLESTIHSVEKGDFDVRAEVRSDNEIGHLSTTFNLMVGRIQGLMDRAVADEEQKRQSEIKALQAQINPHFLYNTLDTIIWMSAAGKNEEVVHVTSALAQLFRTSISQGESLVPLQLEIENINSYLTIQKMRYTDKLSYSLDIPSSLYFYRLPKLILQPIVENAIYHGIKPLQEGGKVHISAQSTEEKLILTIEDTGVGMTASQIKKLFSAQESDSRSIGILNVHNRIRLLFGIDYGLVYTSQQDKGTRVDIHLPLIQEGDTDAKT